MSSRGGAEGMTEKQPDIGWMVQCAVFLAGSLPSCDLPSKMPKGHSKVEELTPRKKILLTRRR